MIWGNWICLVFVSFLWDTVKSLKITSLYVPRGASHEAPIDCRYDLEGQPLYDVKWYKDDMQFFRCMADGTVQEFPVDGVSVYYSNYAAVGSCHVKLAGLTSNSGGVYKCEVSLDAPTFRTVSESKTLKIIQYSRRTQTQENITERVKSVSKNQTHNTSNRGNQRSTSLLNIYSLLFIFCFCSFLNKDF